jgi:hypothetical protein
MKGTVELFVHNKLDESTNVSRMEFLSYGVCFSFAWTEITTSVIIIEPNKILRV